MKHIHTTILNTYLKNRQHNKVTNTILSLTVQHSPEQHVVPWPNSEQTNVPYYAHIQTKSRKTKHTSPLCPLCKSEPHTTTHLFNCTNINTQQNVTDLWTAPVEVGYMLVPTTPACTWWNRPEEDNSSGKLESTHPSRTSVKSDQGFFGVESVMRVNADSLLIRAAATSTSGTLNDLTTDLIMANNNNYNNMLVEWRGCYQSTSGSGFQLDGGNHRPVCVETVIGPIHHVSVEGWVPQQHVTRS